MLFFNVDVVYYLFNLIGISSQLGRLMLPKWVKVSGKRFNEILTTVTKAKNDGLKTNVDGREITLDNTETLLKPTVSGKIDGSEFKKEYNNIVNDVNVILKVHKITILPMITRAQKKTVEFLLLLTDIAKPKDKQPDEQPDTINMPELESEESAEQNKKQRGVGLKILTPDQMLSRLPITLAQLKSGNNSQKLTNEIRQLFYFLYRSKN